MNTPFQGATRRNLLLGAGALGLAAPSIARAQGQYRAEYKIRRANWSRCARA